ncbi:hypothetical protein P22_0554 [Propionispora sp. 2/2-37]|uniref:glycosyltransferase n=1 Tax=Propionispora sp. 2/2-37 TaxID=1677858 RepID=UPI0006BB7707|nr:glycosyltransferase [Propionispora sp. 2/2-37]CUH94488.1 hypothetical protein P22_0554 [Propionispora sp. 2/2-37]
MIEKIIITSDLLRPSIRNEKIEVFNNTRVNKYFHFLCWQLQQATSIKIERLNCDHTDFNVEYFYQLCGISEFNTMGWLEILDLENIPEKAIEYYRDYIKNSLVIYLEIPLILKKIHDLLNIPYIDLVIHPIRFLDDNFYGFATNSKSLFDKMKRYQIDDNIFFVYAGLFKAAADHAPVNIDENSVLIAGQIDVDRALYSQGRCLSIFDYEDKIERLGEEYNTVYYKPHPFNKNLQQVYEFLEKFNFIKIINDNIYRIISNDNIKKVCAISSGILYESVYFGKEIEAFHQRYLNYNYDKNCTFSDDIYLSIYDAYLNPIFWKDVLSDLIPVNENCPNVVLPPRANKIRAAFNDYWSQTPLDPAVRIVEKHLDERIRHLEDNTNRLIANEDIGLIKKVVYHINRNFFMKTRGFRKISDLLALYKFKSLAGHHIKDLRKINKVKFISYRPYAPSGGRGGAGAVLSALKKTMGSSYKRLALEFCFSERDGIWHTGRNSYYNQHKYPNFFMENTLLLMLFAAIAFTIEKTKDETDAIYVCHDYATAFGLALLKKKYTLVLHSQGPRVEEKINLGEEMSIFEKKVIQRCEKYALQHAVYVCFPSIGAKDYYFSSKYNIINESEVALGPTLYNTLYAEVLPEKIPGIERDNEYLTLLSVGTMTYAKGTDQSFKAIAEIVKLEYKKKIRWIVVGKGPLSEKVLEYSRRLEKEFDNFKFIYIKQCSFLQVQYLQEIADVYIMLHRISIFDLATLEAMNKGLAIVLSNIGGNIEFNKEDNIIFHEHDYRQTAKKILSADINQLKELNRKVYNNYFGNEKFKAEYENLIDLMLED